MDQGQEPELDDDFGTSDFAPAYRRGPKIDSTDVLRPSDAVGSTDRITENQPASAAVPQLLVGSKLDKVMKLTPNRWMVVGSSPKASLLIHGKNVSREHCMLRWDSHQRHVELLDRSTYGTLVNDQPVRHKRRILRHGDRIGILSASDSGNKKKYVFVVDLRSVGLGKEDPRVRTTSSLVSKLDSKEKKYAAYESRLKTHSAHLEGLDQLALEKKYQDELAARRTRALKMEEAKQKLKEMWKEIEAQKQSLKESREEWSERLRKAQESNAKQAAPLCAHTADSQTRLEKLKLKKAELQRRLHPELYEMMEAPPSPTGSLSKLTKASTPTRSLAEDTEEEHARLAIGDDGGAPAASSSAAAPASGVEKDEAAEIFGDFDSEEEAAVGLPDAKRPRTGA